MSLDGVNLHLVDSIAEASALMRWLGERPAQLGALALDTESTGLSPERDRVRLVQVSDDQTGWAIPFERWGGVVEELVHKWDKRYIMHNATFDVSMLDSEGIRIDRSRIDDTRIAGHVLEPTESTALKNQASRHVDPRAASLQRALDEFMNKWTWATVPIESTGPAAIYWQYGALDAILTYQLANVHLPRVAVEAPKAYELELGVSFVVSNMERRGVRVDRAYTQKYSQAFLEFIDNVDRWCEQAYGIKAGTTQAVIDILQRETTYEFTVRTDGGALSLNKEVLHDVIAKTQHPLAVNVLRRRQTQKLHSTYLRRFLEFSAFDGFIHPSINSIGGSGKQTGSAEGLYGVRTGRMSMDSPNFQQLPRRSEENTQAIIVRNCVVPRDDDHILLMSDFDQIEMRVLAHLAHDEGMRQAFMQSGVDFFTEMTRTIFHDPSIVKKDPRRQTTKNSAYANAYGAGPAKFALTAGITLQEAYEFLARFDALYPGVKRLKSEVDKRATERRISEGVAYVRSPFTGRRHVADEGREYALVNYLIQGSCAEIFKMKLLELDAAGLGEFMILPVHDEVIFDVPESHEKDAIQAIREVMNDDTLCSVPITAGVARGRRWGEKADVA